jgi:hypothetical protein
MARFPFIICPPALLERLDNFLSFPFILTERKVEDNNDASAKWRKDDIFFHAQKNGKEMFKSSSNGLMYNAIPVLICVFIQSQEGGGYA